MPPYASVFPRSGAAPTAEVPHMSMIPTAAAIALRCIAVPFILISVERQYGRFGRPATVRASRFHESWPPALRILDHVWSRPQETVQVQELANRPLEDLGYGELVERLRQQVAAEKQN